MSYKVRIIDAKPGEPVRNVILKVLGRNIRGIPAKFELIDDDQPTDVSSGDTEFVVATVPAKMFEGGDL